jgi:hypothetical protein
MIKLQEQQARAECNREELKQLRTRYLSMVADLRRQWWECCAQGQGNSDLAHLIWGMRSTLEQLARSIQLALEERGIVWLQYECSTHMRCAMQELAPDWAKGKPLWWLWACRKEAAFHRLTRQIATKALAKSSTDTREHRDAHSGME